MRNIFKLFKKLASRVSVYTGHDLLVGGSVPNPLRTSFSLGATLHISVSFEFPMEIKKAGQSPLRQPPQIETTAKDCLSFSVCPDVPVLLSLIAVPHYALRSVVPSSPAEPFCTLHKFLFSHEAHAHILH